MYTSNAKNRFTDFRAPCASLAHATNTLSATGYAKLGNAPSKTAYPRIQPFPPIRRGSNNRQGAERAARPTRSTGGQHVRVLRVFRGFLAFGRRGREPTVRAGLPTPPKRPTEGLQPLAHGRPSVAGCDTVGRPWHNRAARVRAIGSIIPTSSPLSRGRGPLQPRNRATRLATLRSRAVVSRREPAKVNRENATGRSREGRKP